MLPAVSLTVLLLCVTCLGGDHGYTRYKRKELKEFIKMVLVPSLLCIVCCPSNAPVADLLGLSQHETMRHHEHAPKKPKRTYTCVSGSNLAP